MMLSNNLSDSCFKNRIIILYLCALFFIGFSYLSVLPVFEGYDETAHFSSLREIADTGKMPIYGISGIDQLVVDYTGPMPYGSGTPPFDSGLVYPKFFSQARLIDGYEKNYRQFQLRSRYRSNPNQINWQAQHPPLYYFLLAPLEKITENLPFVTQILCLRTASYILALCGVFFAVLALKFRAPVEAKAAMIGFSLYPIIFPEFFPEFARIGNDSLCLFLMGLFALVFSKWYLQDSNNIKLPILIGIILGFGLLTKAFFIPILVATVLFLTAPLMSKKNNAIKLKPLFLMIMPAFLIGSGWYFYKLLYFGNLIGSDDAIKLAKQGGFLFGFKAHFSLYVLLKGLITTFISFIWAGAWSLVHTATFLYLPLLLLIVLIFTAFFLEMKNKKMLDMNWLVIWLYIIFCFGFLYHIILCMALMGIGNTPGWYLHILMPFAAPGVGIGISTIWRNKTARLGFRFLLIYALLFEFSVFWSQLTLFSGCSVKGSAKQYLFSGDYFCIDQWRVVLDHFSVLGFPLLAGASFFVGLSLAILLYFNMKKE